MCDRFLFRQVLVALSLSLLLVLATLATRYRGEITADALEFFSSIATKSEVSHQVKEPEAFNATPSVIAPVPLKRESGIGEKQAETPTPTLIPTASRTAWSPARISPRPRLYPPVPESEVFGTALPDNIPQALVALDWVDFVLPGGELLRQNVRNLSFDMLFNASRPAAFLLNLDRRTDRLREVVKLWSDSVQLLRVSAKPHVKLKGVALNGCGLSHIALILAMQTHGWPYVLILEDDADPLPAWHELLPRILAAINARDGDVGLVNLGPQALGGRLVPAPLPLLFRADSFLASQSVLYGRRMIPAAAAFLHEKAGRRRRGQPAAPHDLAFGVEHVGIGPPNLLTSAHVMTKQRRSVSDIERGNRPVDLGFLWDAAEAHLARALGVWERMPPDRLARENATSLPY